jgi:hypothetical protein
VSVQDIILPRLAGEAKSYAERLFSFPEVGALSSDDGAWEKPEQAGGCSGDVVTAANR